MASSLLQNEKVASTLKNNESAIAVTKTDATPASMLASRFHVCGFPTIKILKKDQAVDYEGSRTQEKSCCQSQRSSQPDSDLHLKSHFHSLQITSTML